jgi:hypothetical protein
MTKRLAGILSAALLLVLPACTAAPTPTPTATPTADDARTEEIVRAIAEEAVAALRDRDMEALAALAHPSKGVRFSPYTYVRDEHLVFGSQSVVGLLMDQTRYLWGYYDGSGEPIELTFAHYYEQFVYDQDFAHAEQIAYNEVLGQGNTINNIPEFYPDGVFVEYYFSGFDPQYGGMDWVSLRLVLEQEGGVWYLVGVIHDEWTI